VDIVEPPARDVDDKVVDLVIGESEAHPVHTVEGDRGGECESFVAVDKRVTSCERVKQEVCERVPSRAQPQSGTNTGTGSSVCMSMTVLPPSGLSR
jgi:hypothetical protein